MGQIELLLTVWITFVTFVASDVPGGYYQTKYDGLDVEDVLNHKRLVHHYAACLLNRGPCPPQGADLKRILPESIQTSCLRCTEKQKVVIIKTIRRLRAEYPSLWKELVDYYDPTEVGIRKIEETIDKELYGSDNDQSNFIGNRFNEDSGNDLAAPVGSDEPSHSSTTTKRPSTTTSTTTVRPAPSYLPPSSTTPKPTTSSSSGVSTYPPVPVTTTTVITGGSSSKPLAFLPSNNVETVDGTTTSRPSIITRWKLTTVPTGTGPALGWRPSQAFNIPIIKVDAGIRFLGSILQTGTEVAGMVLNTVQQVFGGRPIN